MNLKQLKRKLKKKRPKSWEKAGKHWEVKMIKAVSDFTFNLEKYINPKAKKVLGKEEWLYNGPKIEYEITKLLKKVRRITLAEHKK